MYMEATTTKGKKEVWVFAEVHEGRLAPVAEELPGAAADLADALDGVLCAVLMGHQVKGLAAELFAAGCQRVYLVEDALLETYTAECYATALAGLIDRHHPEILLFGATALGRDLAPRVAVYAETGLTANCLKLEIDPQTGCLLQTRPAFAQNLMATIVCPRHRPQIATVRPGVFQKRPLRGGAWGEVVTEPPMLKKEDLLVTVEILDVAGAGTPSALDSARIVVGGGLGVGGAEGFELLHALADRLGGAVGATRAAVDAGWIDEGHQIGQTGKIIAPDLYLACGISGEVQHMAGVQRAKRVVAINKNPQAPIFSAADYGLVGDCREIVRALLWDLEQRP